MDLNYYYLMALFLYIRIRKCKYLQGSNLAEEIVDPKDQIGSSVDDEVHVNKPPSEVTSLFDVNVEEPSMKDHYQSLEKPASPPIQLPPRQAHPPHQRPSQHHGGHPPPWANQGLRPRHPHTGYDNHHTRPRYPGPPDHHYRPSYGHAEHEQTYHHEQSFHPRHHGPRHHGPPHGYDEYSGYEHQSYGGPCHAAPPPPPPDSNEPTVPGHSTDDDEPLQDFPYRERPEQHRGPISPALSQRTGGLPLPPGASRSPDALKHLPGFPHGQQPPPARLDRPLRPPLSRMERPPAPKLDVPPRPPTPKLDGPPRHPARRIDGPPIPLAPRMDGPTRPLTPRLEGPSRPPAPRLDMPSRPPVPRMDGPPRPPAPSMDGLVRPPTPRLDCPPRPPAPRMDGPPRPPAQRMDVPTNRPPEYTTRQQAGFGQNQDHGPRGPMPRTQPSAMNEYGGSLSEQQRSYQDNSDGNSNVQNSDRFGRDVELRSYRRERSRDDNEDVNYNQIQRSRRESPVRNRNEPRNSDRSFDEKSTDVKPVKEKTRTKGPSLLRPGNLRFEKYLIALLYLKKKNKQKKTT